MGKLDVCHHYCLCFTDSYFSRLASPDYHDWSDDDGGGGGDGGGGSGGGVRILTQS